MLGIGWIEILVVLLLGFLVLGPDKMVEAVRLLGKSFRQVREATDEITASLNVDLLDEKQDHNSEKLDVKPDGSHPKD
jgi:Tat protein translocase TatB subunit